MKFLRSFLLCLIALCAAHSVLDAASWQDPSAPSSPPPPPVLQEESSVDVASIFENNELEFQVIPIHGKKAFIAFVIDKKHYAGEDIYKNLANIIYSSLDRVISGLKKEGTNTKKNIINAIENKMLNHESLLKSMPGINNVIIVLSEKDENQKTYLFFYSQKLSSSLNLVLNSVVYESEKGDEFEINKGGQANIISVHPTDEDVLKYLMVASENLSKKLNSLREHLFREKYKIALTDFTAGSANDALIVINVSSYSSEIIEEERAEEKAREIKGLQEERSKIEQERKGEEEKAREIREIQERIDELEIERKKKKERKELQQIIAKKEREREIADIEEKIDRIERARESRKQEEAQKERESQARREEVLALRKEIAEMKQERESAEKARKMAELQEKIAKMEQAQQEKEKPSQENYPVIDADIWKPYINQSFISYRKQALNLKDKDTFNFSKYRKLETKELTTKDADYFERIDYDFAINLYALLKSKNLLLPSAFFNEDQKMFYIKKGGSGSMSLPKRFRHPTKKPDDLYYWEFGVKNNYKIHLMPKKEEFLPIIIKLLELMDGGKISIDTAKVNVQYIDNLKYINKDTDHKKILAGIILYFDGKDDCQNALNILYREFDGAQGVGIRPRFNAQVNDLIYVAQGGGDDKKFYKMMPYMKELFDDELIYFNSSKFDNENFHLKYPGTDIEIIKSKRPEETYLPFSGKGKERE